MTQEQQAMAEARKARSIEILEREGIPYIQHLPLIEPEGLARLRTREEIVRRAACVFLTAVCSWQLVRLEEENRRGCTGFYHRAALEWGLEEALSQAETALMTGKAGEREIRAATWRMEAFLVLAWALGMVPALGLPREQFQGDLEDFFPSLRPEAFREFAARAKRRTDGEILDEADLIYRVRWATEEARIHGEEAPAGIDSDVAMEWHTALNWLVGYGGEDWDHISLDT